MNNAVKNYQQAQVNTVGNGEVIILLYEGAIRFLTQAKEKIAEKDYAGKGVLISRAMDIVHELDNSLNMEKGGEIAQNLHGLYVFASTTLLRANIKLDCDMIDSVIHILAELKWSFEHIVNTPEAKAAEEEIRQTRNSSFVSRAVTTSNNATAGHRTASSAYANVAKGAGVEVVGQQGTASNQVNAPTKNVVSAEMVGSFLSQKASSLQNVSTIQTEQSPVASVKTQVTQTANPFTLNNSIGATKAQMPLNGLQSNVKSAQAPSNVAPREQEKVLNNPLLARLATK